MRRVCNSLPSRRFSANIRFVPNSLTQPAAVVRDALQSSPLIVSQQQQQRRALSGGTRGARGHGWYVNYRAGKGGRHLQGEYHDRDSPQGLAAWNDAVLQLGSLRVYLDVVMEPRRNDSSPINKRKIDSPPLDSLVGEKHRLTIDIAVKVMPETTQNFIDLLKDDEHGYKGKRLYRVEKNVGVLGGDTVTNTGKLGRAAHPTPMTTGNPNSMEIANDPLALWHIPGTVSMLVKDVGSIDSRFILVTQAAPHMDGMARAFGRMTPESLDIATKWQSSLITQIGVPAAFDLVIKKCGVIGPTRASNTISTDTEETKQVSEGLS